MISAITVTYNTREIFERAYESVRVFHPQMKIIIVDGSDKEDPCYEYVKSLAADLRNEVYQVGYNIGHGKGMHLGLSKCKSKYAMLFDSDIIMKKDPTEQMVKLMTPGSYGIGWLTEIGYNGFDFGTPGMNHKEAVPYIHPYFMILDVAMYFKFHPFVHHGAPCYKAAIDLYQKKQSWRLRNFGGLTGHTSGEGINWRGRPNDYIQHDFGGTRNNNTRQGKGEIDGIWE